MVVSRVCVPAVCVAQVETVFFDNLMKHFDTDGNGTLDKVKFCDTVAQSWLFLQCCP